MTEYLVRSEKRDRLYVRRFDHDEARRLHLAGASVQALADQYGVTAHAVRRVVDARVRARDYARKKKWLRENKVPCVDCGAPIWRTAPNSRCRTCSYRRRVAADVRDGELRCSKCRQWKPDEAFPTYAASPTRRGRKAQCRECSNEVRRAYRAAHAVAERAAATAYKQRKRGAKVSKFVVLRSVDGAWVELGEHEAPTRERAVEAAAREEGVYAAVPAGQLRPMHVAPTTAFRVVDDVHGRSSGRGRVVVASSAAVPARGAGHDNRRVGRA